MMQNLSMHVVKVIAFSLYILFTIFQASGQEMQHAPTTPAEFQRFAVKTFSAQDGLPAKNTTAALKDSRGFMWIGTENGLCKFDGYTFKTFVNIAGDSSTITNNFINAIVEDKKGRLWVGTMDGLNLFDPIAETSKRFVHKENTPGSISNNKIWSILCDKQGVIWVGTDYGFNAYNEKQQGFAVYLPRENRPGFMSGKSVNAIVEDKNNNLWLGNWSTGLNKFNKSNKRFSNYQQVQLPGQKNPNDVWSLALADDGNIWIGTYWNGLFKFNPETAQFTACPSTDKANTAAFSILKTDRNTLLVGGNNGFYWVNTLNNRWEKLAGIPGSPESDLYYDRHGILWICTKGGLTKIDYKQYKFAFLPLALQDMDVRSLVATDQELWLGTNKGLFSYNIHSGKIKTFKHSADPHSITSNDIKKLYLDSNGQLWIATENGFDLYHPQENTFIHHFHHSALGSLYNEDVFRDIVEGAPGEYWLATDAGLKMYNDKNKSYTHYYNKENTPSSLNNNHLYSLLKDADGNIWVATYGGGLNKLDRKTGRFSAFKFSDGKAGTISNNIILNLFQDSRNNIWVCTPSGLNKYDKNTNTFQVYSKSAGFAGNMFYNLLEDKKGLLWVLTEKGLSSFNPKTRQVKNFDEADGVYSSSTIAKTGAGEIYLAGPQGLVYFNPERIQYNKELVPVYFTDFQIFNRTVQPGSNSALKEALGLAKKVVLKYDENVFSFEFVALNYTHAEKNEYAYKLEGFDKKWNYVGKQRRASYTNLNPGSYKLWVKASNNDGVWNTIGRSITIVVLPPWYLQWWAYLVYAILFSGALYLFMRYKNRQSQLQYEIKVAHIESEKEKELNEKKLAFFTNISHEFRTPLTLIINPVKELLSKPGNTEDHGTLNVVHRNAARLLSLVDQLLLFRKAESEADQLHISKLNIVTLCNEVFNCFSHQMRSKNMEYTFEHSTDNIELYADREKLEIALFNLLANAIKFTPAKGRITLSVLECNGQLQITVQDSGCGISEQAGDKLYTRFYQGPNAHTSLSAGFGIGLYLVRKFVESHAGSVSYSSIPGLGTTFHINLLLGKAHLAGCTILETEDSSTGFLMELLHETATTQTATTQTAPSQTLTSQTATNSSNKGSARARHEVNNEIVGANSRTKGAEPANTGATTETGQYGTISNRNNAKNGLDGLANSRNNQNTNANNPKIQPELPDDAATLLIIDDNQEIREYIKQVFRNDYILYEADSGETGHRLIIEQMPDLVISDVMMEGMTGLQLCSLVKHDPATSFIPVILLTANTSAEVMLKGLEGGADDYISKPFDKDVLKAKVENILKSKNNLQKYFFNQVTLNTDNPKNTGNPKISIEYREFLDRCIQIVERHLTDQDFNIQTLASEIGMSTSGLYKKIKAISGQSSNSFIRFIRLRKAAEIFINTDNTIAETSYLIGINDPKYFREQFCKLFKMNPSDYIKKYRRPFSNTFHNKLRQSKSDLS
jgi:ligand-binding sensor domain-containing protein/signal transduction histidine kinase/CheY-like chemotaxis protein/AraC-like DNA-binding protein